MLDTHPDREPTLGKGEDLGISQLGSFNRGRHWDSGSILGLWIHSGTLDPFWDTAVLRRDIQRISRVGVWDWIIC